MPNELISLKGRDAIFRIESEGSPGGQFEVSYHVKNVSEDIDLIKNYMAKWGIQVARLITFNHELT